VVFTASVPTSSTLPVQYAGDFGDGSNGGGMVVTHTFASMGQYSILLTTSNCGGQVSVTHPLQVSGVPGIDVQPVSLQTTLSPGGEQGQPLVISNTGTAPLVWNLTEKPAVSWLSETITQGDVNPGGSVGVTLGFVAPRTQGVYTTSLLISSNDVQQPQVRLPVTLTIYPRQIFLPVISRR
jgi:PKD repeat protein